MWFGEVLPSMIWAAEPAWIDKPKSSSSKSQVHQACLEQVCQKKKGGGGVEKNETKECNTEAQGGERKSKI